MQIGTPTDLSTTRLTGSEKIAYDTPDPLLNPVDKTGVTGSADSTSRLMDDMKKLQTMAASQQAETKTDDLTSRLDDLFKEAKDCKNPVISSCEPIIRNSRHISMDMGKVKEWAGKLTQEQLNPCNWKLPTYIDEDSPRTFDFFMLMNSINFMFFDEKTGEKFRTEYQGKQLSGSEAMTASIKRAMEEGVPILNADFLANVTEDEMRSIFRGNMEMPLLRERTEIFHEVGNVLKEKYDGSFANLAKAANNKAFDNGNGMVERLTRDFPSFKDNSLHQATGTEAVFNKRAQLAVGMLASRLEETGLFDCPDIQDLTVFADYQLPRGLRTMGILKYEPELADRVDNKKPIAKDSDMEQELRAYTVVAAKLLQDEINKREGIHCDARGIDSLLWWSARQDKNSQHHMTVTTAY